MPTAKRSQKDKKVLPQGLDLHYGSVTQHYQHIFSPQTPHPSHFSFLCKVTAFKHIFQIIKFFFILFMAFMALFPFLVYRIGSLDLHITLFLRLSSILWDRLLLFDYFYPINFSIIFILKAWLKHIFLE